MTSNLHTPHGQRGQSLVEFLALALALVPMFLLFPMIGKYQDIAHATQIASRYVAFEAFTRNAQAAGSWKPETQLADEVRRRFFGAADSPVKTNDVAGDFDAHRNLLWRDPQGNALIRNFGSDVTVSFGTGRQAMHDDAFSRTHDGTPFVLSDPLELRARGIYTANVRVRLANLPAGLRMLEPFDTINLSMARSTSVVIDPWTARGPAQVETTLGASPLVFPAAQLAAPLQAVGSAVTLIDLPGSLPPPQLGQLSFWRDVVPQDRLKQASP